MHRVHAAEDEAAHLLELYGTAPEAIKVLSAQFGVIQSRTQLILTLATIMLSITGFSGPRIAESGLFARGAMVIGLAFVLLGLGLALLGSLRIRWLTQFIGGDIQARLAAMISYRNRKTVWFAWELALIVIGLACYVAAVVAFLLTTPPKA